MARENLYKVWYLVPPSRSMQFVRVYAVNTQALFEKLRLIANNIEVHKVVKADY